MKTYSPRCIFFRIIVFARNIDDSGPDPDAGPDPGSGPDTRPDPCPNPDSGPDPSPDPCPDAGPDSGQDPGPDSDPDTGPDSGPHMSRSTENEASDICGMQKYVEREISEQKPSYLGFFPGMIRRRSRAQADGGVPDP
jgi:hypothetical protein